MNLAETRGNVVWTVHQLQDLWKGIRLEDIRMDVGHMVVSEGIPVWKAWPLSLWGQVIWMARSLRCCFTDHDIVDMSYSNPESGNVCIVCKRCGKTLIDQYLY